VSLGKVTIATERYNLIFNNINRFFVCVLNFLNNRTMFNVNDIFKWFSQEFEFSRPFLSWSSITGKVKKSMYMLSKRILGDFIARTRNYTALPLKFNTNESECLHLTVNKKISYEFQFHWNIFDDGFHLFRPAIT